MKSPPPPPRGILIVHIRLVLEGGLAKLYGMFVGYVYVRYGCYGVFCGAINC